MLMVHYKKVWYVPGDVEGRVPVQGWVDGQEGAKRAVLIQKWHVGNWD